MSTKIPRLLTVNLEGKLYRVGYKVVTEDMKSLGLRKNPHIMTFNIAEWIFLPENQVVPGNGDYGGIWLAISLSNARRLREYMLCKHERETKIFEALIDRVLYSNSYRVKTNGLMLVEEKR